VLKSEQISEEFGLTYKLSVPSDGRGGRPLLVMLHGYAGDEESMWTFTRGLEGVKPVVVAPRGFLEAEPARLEREGREIVDGYCWWTVDTLPNGEPRKDRRTTTADLEFAFERVEPFIEGIVSKYDIDRSRIVGVGFSQGSAVLSSLSLHKPGLLKGMAFLAGFTPSCVFKEGCLVSPEVKEGRVKLPRYFMAHGTQDRIIEIHMARRAKAELEKLGAGVEFHTDQIGHKIGPNGVRGLRRWLTQMLSEEG